MGCLMIVLIFVGGVIFAGAFNGFVVEIEASSCCGGETNTCGDGTDALIFSSSECCDEDRCAICSCNIAGCDGDTCTRISCKDCSCGTSGGEGVGGNAADGCGSECSSETDKEHMCNNDCSYT